MIKAFNLCILLLSLPGVRGQAQGSSLQPPAGQTGHQPPSPHPALIKKLSLHEYQIDLSFPLITLPDPAASKKINADLQKELLQQDTVRRTAKHLFDSIKFVSPGGGTDDLDYTVLVNSPKLLSLEFDGTYEGAYPTGFEQYFQFYTRTGEPIELEDIMTWEGRVELGKDLIRKRKILIAAHLEELKKDTEAVKELEWIKTSFRENNEGSDSSLFSIQPTGLLFHKGQSLPHVILCYDTDLDIKYSFQQFAPWLNDFGKKLLLKP